MKKKLFFLFTILLISKHSYAITGKDDWIDIRVSNEVIIQQPTFAGAFGPDGLFNACTTDDEFRSLRPVKTCLEYRKDNICIQYETRPVSIARTYIQNVCLKYTAMRCVEYGAVTSVYPTSFSFPVIEGNGQEYGSFLFSKTFALQSCE